MGNLKHRKIVTFQGHVLVRVESETPQLRPQALQFIFFIRILYSSQTKLNMQKKIIYEVSKAKIYNYK